MADLHTIADRLRGIAAGVERTQHAVAAADARAEEIAQRALLTGFAGIALGVQQVRMSLGEVRQRLVATGHGVTEAAGPVAGASGRPSPEETVALLDPASERVGTVRAELAGLVEQVTGVQQWAGVVLHGGQPGPMIAALDEVKQLLTELIGQSDLTREALREAIVEARRLGEQRT